jgi:hypothetical protein
VTRSRPVGMALLAVLGLGLALSLSLSTVLGRLGPPEATAPSPAGTAPAVTGPAAAGTPPVGPAARALDVLHRWDSRRAAAYAAGSPGRLSDLYLPGSAAGAADVHLLQRYRDRGLRVVRMRTQVLALVVLERRADRWTLRVTDRLDAAVASRGTSQVRLPRDASSVRVLVLTRSSGRWRMADVLPARRASRARPPAGSSGWDGRR